MEMVELWYFLFLQSYNTPVFSSSLYGLWL